MTYLIPLEMWYSKKSIRSFPESLSHPLVLILLSKKSAPKIILSLPYFSNKSSKVSGSETAMLPSVTWGEW